MDFLTYSNFLSLALLIAPTIIIRSSTAITTPAISIVLFVCGASSTTVSTTGSFTVISNVSETVPVLPSASSYVTLTLIFPSPALTPVSERSTVPLSPTAIVPE